MNRRCYSACIWILITAWVAAGGVWASVQPDALSAVQLLREGGCGGILPAARALHHDGLLDRAAQQWAAGRTLEEATERSGYQAQATAGVHVSGPPYALVQVLRKGSCPTVLNPGMRDIGIYTRGLDSWLLLASAYVVPSRSQAPALAMRALQLVNEARARGARCGERPFAPAPPVTLSGTLADVALGHASDMAAHSYFEHEDLSGHSPADRVRAVGYKEKLVGENIAFGPESAEEVVKGWLDSPGHCENIMDPRFAEMGIAYAAGRSPSSAPASVHGLYWVQVLAAPRATSL
ncbi:MAG TPA: CAP domain-containing protein [Steroidobacteraceae bacterium]|nr:CAP domain-containing protein [Steroidobacteraceae bacterium]